MTNTNLKFNENSFNSFKHYNNKEISLEHLLDVLNSRSSRSILDTFNHNCIPYNVFTWVKNNDDETKVLTVQMRKISTGFKFNLDIEENGKMFLSEGKDTHRTPLPVYELNNLSSKTKNKIRQIIETFTTEGNWLREQDMFNRLGELLDNTNSYYLLEKAKEQNEYKVLKYGTPINGKTECLISISNEHIKDEMKIDCNEPFLYTLLIGKKEKDENNRTVRYINVFYKNRIITNREFMYEPVEWYSYYDEEQEKWIIPQDEYCYNYRTVFEMILNEYSDKEGAFFYYRKTREIHIYFDEKNSPKIWLRQYGTERITDQVNFDKTIDYELSDFKLSATEQLEASQQVIEPDEELQEKEQSKWVILDKKNK